MGFSGCRSCDGERYGVGVDKCWIIDFILASRRNDRLSKVFTTLDHLDDVAIVREALMPLCTSDRPNPEAFLPAQYPEGLNALMLRSHKSDYHPKYSECLNVHAVKPQGFECLRVLPAALVFCICPKCVPILFRMSNVCFLPLYLPQQPEPPLLYRRLSMIA